MATTRVFTQTQTFAPSAQPYTFAGAFKANVTGFAATVSGAIADPSTSLRLVLKINGVVVSDNTVNGGPGKSGTGYQVDNTYRYGDPTDPVGGLPWEVDLTVSGNVSVTLTVSGDTF